MALIKCPECGRENVSDSAESCPDCGYGIKAYFEQLKVKKYYSCNTLFSFLDGFDEGIDGIYTVDWKDTKYNYSVRDGKILLPSDVWHLICEDFLLAEKEDEFSGSLPLDETFDAVIIQNIPNRKWTFYKDGVLKKDDGEIGIYKRTGHFLIYKIANHSGITWRDKPMALVIYNDKIYEEGRCFFSEKQYNNLVTLKNEMQNQEYPFAKPEPLGSVDYSYANAPKCPICNSTKLSKISTASKATKVGLFGIFGAGDLGKTWKCNNCGSKF